MLNKLQQLNWRRPQGLVLPAALIALLFATSSSRAAFISYTASGTNDGYSVSASASFTTSSGQIVITLTNTLAASSFVDAAQAISQISFTLSNAVGTVGTQTASGQLGNIDARSHVWQGWNYVTNPNYGKVTYKTGAGSTNPNRWVDNSPTIHSYNTTVTLTPGGVQMIAPYLANGGDYGSPHSNVDDDNPYVIGTATFTLNLGSITANTNITGMTFRFGEPGYCSSTTITGVRDNSVNDPVITPEPATMALAISGLGTFGIAGLRRLRRKQGDVTA